jgi:hypothetical protein
MGNFDKVKRIRIESAKVDLVCHAVAAALLPFVIAGFMIVKTAENVGHLIDKSIDFVWGA